MNEKQAKDYQIQTAIKLARRNRQQSCLSLIGGGSYFLLLVLGLSASRVITDIKGMEAHVLADAQELVSLSQGHLVQMLSQIELGLFLLIGSLIFFGYFFFLTASRRQLVLRQEELQIKCLLGASVSHVHREFYLEYALPLIAGGGVGIVTGIGLFSFVRLVLTWGSPDWPTSWGYPLGVSGWVTVITLLLLLVQYRKSKKLIRNLTN